MYHRISEPTCDPWQLAVSPENFERQLNILQSKYKVISLSELLTHLKNKSIPSNAVCITFDDGYEDNYLAAKPLLEKFNCPAAFFIASHYVEHRQSFWWDELEAVILLSKTLPSVLSIDIGNEKFEFRLANDSVLSDIQLEKHKNWIWTENPPTQRCELFLALYRRLKPLLYEQITVVIESIKNWANYNEINEKYYPLTKQQLKEMGDNPLFEIGLHTVTHTALAFQDRERQSKEIIENEKQLKKICKNVTKAAAYPFGNFDETTISITKELALAATFTTRGNTVTNHADIYRLGRFQVKNLNEKEFERQLIRWRKNI